MWWSSIICKKWEVPSTKPKNFWIISLRYSDYNIIQKLNKKLIEELNKLKVDNLKEVKMSLKKKSFWIE